MQSKLGDYIYLKVVGKDGMESFYLDSFLSILREHGEGINNIPKFSGNIAYTQQRIESKLLKDGYIERLEVDGGFKITSDGMLHLENGGYRKEMLYKKLNRLSFWFSLLATILSIVAIFL